MGDLNKMAKAKMDLEELYMGIPDDSVNLTFQDLADVKQNTDQKKKSTSPPKQPPSHHPLTKLPSLDFSRGLQASQNHHHNHNHNHHQFDHVGHEGHSTFDSHRPRHGHHHHHHLHHDVEGMHGNHQRHHAVGISSMAYDDDVSVISMTSMFRERGGRGRRPGIPHSNICTICSTYIYIFRHRCLVCGRVYYKNCMKIGMGEMTEGRKCMECLGRRFSQRYIQRAGQIGCCSTYPSLVKQAELKWAEKGPRRSGDGERACGPSTMMSRSRCPVTPSRAHAGSNPPSFITSSPYSPYSPNHHHLPL